MSTTKGIKSDGGNPQNYHVTIKGDKREVKKERSNDAKICDTIEDAIQEGKKMAQKEGVDLIIHDKNGKIKDRITSR